MIISKHRVILFLISIFSCPLYGGGLEEMYTEDEVIKTSRLQTFISRGNIQMAGMTGKIETVYKVPGRIRSSLYLTDFEIIQIFNGKSAWMKDQNGQVIQLTGSDKKQLVNSAWLFGKSYLFDDRISGSTQFLKDTLINECAYRLYAALPDDGDSLWLLYNVDSGRIDITIERLDDIQIYSYLSDFKEIDGFDMPFENKTISNIEQFNSMIRIDEIEINEEIADSIFEFSDVSVVDSYFPETVDSIIVPMDYYKGHIFLKAAVNNHKKIYFILDSGAGTNILSQGYAEELHIDPVGDFPTKGISGYETAAVARVDSISIDNLRLFGQSVAVVDFSATNLTAPDGQLGGLLGFDLLSRFPLRIDYDNRQLIFYHPERFQPPSSDYELEFEFMMKVPIVSAEIEGFEGKFLIDLGNPMGIILHKPFVDKYNLMESFGDVREIADNLTGIGGSSNVFAATAGYLKLGPARLDDFPVLIAEDDRGLLNSTVVDGNIGNMLFQRFSIVLDYSVKKIYIMPLK